MGLSLFAILSVSKRILEGRLFPCSDADSVDAGSVTEESFILDKLDTNQLRLDTSFSFKNLLLDEENLSRINGGNYVTPSPGQSCLDPTIFSSPRPVCELDAAALKVQKVYKSYRTRRNLADCAVVVEELWWKALDFAALKRSSVSFFDDDKPESAVSRWGRARTRVAKLGKGLCKDEKAQQLAICHWLEAIDPRHRYGHNLHLYYKIWFASQSSQPFFYWLDIGDGKEANDEKCPRNELNRQCIKYLGPKEREEYEVIIEEGTLVYKQSRRFVETMEGSKWIFVLSTSRNLYVGQKKKGQFQHSSFLAGAATTAAGRMVAHNGVLEAIWPYSGHYHPTEENFKEFISFLEEHQVDLTNVKRCAIDDDDPFSTTTSNEKLESDSVSRIIQHFNEEKPFENAADDHQERIPKCEMVKAKSLKWTSGAGPRIGCVREYPTSLQSQALEQVKLSPRPVVNDCGRATFGSGGPIPSPRPSPRIYLSPRLVNMGRNC